MFEDATRLVSAVDMFSENESFEEVTTENVKYFLLPALLGKLATKICGNDDRMHLVKVAEIYFVDFLKRLKAYDLTDVKIPEINLSDEKDDDENNSDMSNRHPPRMLEDMVGYSYFCINRYKLI